MKNKFYTIAALIVMGISANAQVGIGTTTPNASSMLDITSTTKGLLMPRVTSAQRTAIATPAKGLQVFDIITNSPWYHDGTAWVNGASATNYWSVNGTYIYNNSGTNVGINNPSPQHQLSFTGYSATAKIALQDFGTTNSLGIGSNAGQLFFNVGSSGDRFSWLQNEGGPELMTLKGNGNLGIGISTPASKLEVNGASANATSYNAGSTTIIDFTASNLAKTTAAPGAITLNGMRDGGTYTLAVENLTSGTYTFSGTTLATTAIAATPVTFSSPNNGATTASKYTLYTFLMIGTRAYYFMTPGF